MILLEAAASGNWHELRQGVEHGGEDLRQRDEQGNTMLHLAVQAGIQEVVHYLVEAVGMDPLDANFDGVTPLDLAATQHNVDILHYLEQKTNLIAAQVVHNPVRRGFYPDPAWIRVGQDYYMVYSSFFYFPCLPISRSSDLVHWTTVGYAITDPQWAQVRRAAGGRGYWAPDISYDSVSRRYFITATLRGNEGESEPRCQMVTSAIRPEGPYSEPAWIHEDGIDPSLFHDEDGRHYMLLNRGARLIELTADCRSICGPPRLIWGGDCKIKSEGPQLIRTNGYYYLLLAEGGTGRGHRVSVARSQFIEGPYESCPYNPILRQEDENGYLQNCGHGKFLQTADGRWYLCYLCQRTGYSGTAPMGRETAIAEVAWTPDGWPVVRHGRRPSVVLACPIATRKMDTQVPAGFISWCVGEWVTPRGLSRERVRVESGVLSMRGNGCDLCDLDAEGILLMRQQERNFTVSVELDLTAFRYAGEKEGAGVTCYYDETSYLKFGPYRIGDTIHLLIEERPGGHTVRHKLISLPAGATQMTLQVRAETGMRRLQFCTNGSDWQMAQSIPEPHYLTSEGVKAGKRFTGAMVGIYVQGKWEAHFRHWTASWIRPEEQTRRLSE